MDFVYHLHKIKSLTLEEERLSHLAVWHAAAHKSHVVTIAPLPEAIEIMVCGVEIRHFDRRNYRDGKPEGHGIPGGQCELHCQPRPRMQLCNSPSITPASPGKAVYHV